MFLPVNPIVIVRSTEELELLKGGGAGEGAGNRWMKAQERMKGGSAFQLKAKISNY